MSREYIANTLKKLRIKSGFTADEVGQQIGKSGKTVNAWENNRGQPDAEILIKLCDIYNVDNILEEFRENKNPLFNLTELEKQVILAYRAKPEMQNAVNTLLNVPTLIEVKSIAKSTDNHPAYTETITSDTLEKLQNQVQPKSDDEL